MATKSVTYTSSSKLTCTDCLPAEVIVCLKDTSSDNKLADLVCPPEGIPANYTWTTFWANVVSVTKGGGGCCGSSSYKYTLEYEDNILADVDNPIYTDDIGGVICKGCLAQWVTDKAGNDVYLRDNEDGTLTLVSQHGCEYTFEGELIP